MPLQATLESLESLPEEFHEDYEEKDGKFHLKLLNGLVSADKVEDVSGLKSALAKERENASNSSKKLRALEEQFSGIDLEEYNRLKELEKTEAEKNAEKKGEWDKLKLQMTEAHNEELGKRTERENKLLSVLERKTIDAEAISALNELEGNVQLLLPHVKNHVKMVEEDGTFVARVVDDQGNPRVNGEGNFLTVKELVSEMRDQDTYAGAFKVGAKSGTGTPPGGSGEGNGKKGVIPSDLKRGVMKTKDKIAFIKEHGEAEFMKLPF